MWYFGAAQEIKYKVSQISLAEGLSQSIVYDITQDDAGYLWFGTQDGLNRFDGINFTVYKNEPFDTNSISSNQISVLLFDSNNRLWIGTHNKGLNLFNNSNRTFSVVFGSEVTNKNSLNNKSIRCIYEDSKGLLWVGTPRGIASISQDFKIKEYPVNSPENDTVPVFVNSISEYKNHLLIATGKGLFIFDSKTEKTEFISALPYDKVEKNWIISLAVNEFKNKIYAGTHTGLYEFNLENNSINDIISLYRGAAVPTLQKFDDKIIASVEGQGVFEIEGSEIIPLSISLSPYMQPSDVSEVISIHKDKINDNLLWMGTSTRGVLKFNPVLKNFYTDKLEYPGLKTAFVTTVIKDNENNKWVGTPDGLLRINHKGEFKIFDEQVQINKNYKNYIGALLFDSNGRLWIGKADGILVTENSEKETPVFVITHVKKNKGNDVIRGFYESKNGDVYAISKYSILKYNSPGKNFVVVTTNPDTVFSQLPDYSLNGMLIDSKNNMWIASTYGLIFTNAKTNKSQILYHNKNNVSGLRDHSIQHILEDSKNNIWASTANGFSKVVHSGNEIKIENYSSKDGLGNNFVYAILEDKNTGTLWISTNGGLTYFDPEKNIFATFNIHDGLQSNEFNSGAFSVSYDGEMFFGGIEGYTHFYPSEIKLDSTPPRVLIAEFHIPGKEKRTVYFENASSNKKVELKYFENSFTVSFAALHFINPLKNVYAYKLEGYQEDWIYSGNLNSINFSQLPPGDYNLHVKAANSDGIFNETGDILVISILPPFWKKVWFYAAALIFIGMVLYGLHRYRLSLKMQQVLAIDKIRKETAEDFHDELGHKLTTISWFGEIVKSKLKPGNDDAKIYLDKIVETSQQMYHTMKDLLWAMDPDKDTVNDLYTQIKEFGEDLFDKTGIEFNSESNVDLKGNKNLPLYHKRQVILIFKEVMHNTLKHSGANVADFKLIKSNGQIHFQFSDNGKGYTLNGHNTGFGLKNVKRRSQLLNADLKIASTGAGTSVDLSFTSN